MNSIEKLINKYSLLPHPEGGWYIETFRSKEIIAADQLSNKFSGERVMSTAIYFLLEQGNFSAFHRIQSDECWHFYAGQTLEMYVLDDRGGLVITRLGSDIEAGDCYQYVVPANHWFASRPAANSSYCFVGCTVAPGFDYADFELAREQDLYAQFPQHQTLIQGLCR
ncbi:MAG: cupin domain-containing protein [Ferruginibacter sp.]